MITRNGHQLKIIDFGLADSDSYCWLKQAAGTTGYSSPEQLATGGADDRNDIYSLGVLLHYLRIGACYRRVISRCLGPIGNRYGQVDALRKALHRAHRVTVCLVVAFLLPFLAGGALLAYDRLVNPRPHYDMVARFNYSNMLFCSWGGGLVTMRPANFNDSIVEIPAQVEKDGFHYKVDEITFDAFRGDTILRSVIIPRRMYVLKEAFKDCPRLRDLYFRDSIPPSVGSNQWPTQIEKVFDANHFSTVILHVPRGSRARFLSSPWRKFNNIEEYESSR